ncbi:DUF6578 domain-containing protein [Streptomyces purpurascens]|uniref:Uncharacterized protein n=1 Tax=Streptomyces purpurascens TaxID=1924 RepID=A0ABZ1MH78_STREF|nr:DUF6578 domain-containing protein [Streptomyces purpurascens]MCE7050739.1 hypothetical protein [Streptomyces purpurascens]GHA21046.1 hypothetical protein GCM10010303_34180 [Streptomyces purpurascens]
MGLWHVFYADWQMECCGTPFSVGDEVSWPLLLLDADDVYGGGWHDQLTKVAGPVEQVGGVRVVREETGLTVALGGEPGGWIRSVGLLSVERHGASWPQVAGRVRAVQVLSQGYAESPPGSRSWEPVPGERGLRLVEQCPKWFADDAAEQGRRRRESGVVVTLEVPGTDSWLSHAVRTARGMPQQDTEPGAETQGIPAEALTSLLESLSTVAPPRHSRAGRPRHHA